MSAVTMSAEELAKMNVVEEITIPIIQGELDLQSNVAIKQESKQELKEIKEPPIESQNYIFDDDSAFLDISEEFLTKILKQVDELCNEIQIGDPDFKRTIDVNQNLNNAVNCYRLKLMEYKGEIGLRDDYFKYEIDPPDFMESDPEFKPLTKKGKKGNLKKKRLKSIKNENGEDVTNTGKVRKRKIGGGRPKKIRPLNLEDDKLYPYIVVLGKDKFGCQFCTQEYVGRRHVFRHLNTEHGNAIKEKNPDYNAPLKTRFDCEKKECQGLYGNKRHDLWCLKCGEMAKYVRKAPVGPKIPKEQKLCPECGVSVRDLKRHLNAMHYGQKQICAHCARELPSLLSLKDHIQKVHEKIPCDECGKLVARRLMKRHRDSVHTPNDQKKYKCDVCGKGFVAKDHLNDHKNIHTGEKPYKCKFCSACFASKGTHAMHERSHVGRRRDYSKK